MTRLPPDLDRVLLRAQRKQPGERFQTAENFGRALQRVSDVSGNQSGWLQTTTFYAPVSLENPTTLGTRSCST